MLVTPWVAKEGNLYKFQVSLVIYMVSFKSARTTE